MEEAGYEQLIEELTQAVAAAAGVERVSVWRLNGAADAIDAEALFRASEGRHSRGQVIRRDDAPRYFKAISGGRVVDADDVTPEASTAQPCSPAAGPLDAARDHDAALADAEVRSWSRAGEDRRGS